MAYEPFSESTNKIKRNLLAVSFVGVLYGLGKILPTEDAGPLLGYKIVPDFVPYAITMVVFYLIVSLMIHIADDWLSSSRSPFWENLNDVRQKTRDRLIHRLEEQLRESMSWHDSIYGKDSDICQKVAHSFVHSAYGPSAVDFEVNLGNALRTLRDRRSGSGPTKQNRHSVLEFEKKELRGLLEGFEVSIDAAFWPLRKRESKYVKFKNFRFWFEAILPMLVGAAAIFLLWSEQAESLSELPHEGLAEINPVIEIPALSEEESEEHGNEDSDVENRTAAEEDSGS